ncbi:MAG: DUF2851 family protein [Muribaculaceae bacterium]|nr:DUF2851 family protein [Muribaculaceae bacterium]
MEKLYHYLWKTGIRGSDFKDVDGHPIEVLDPGVHNHDSGPDFFNSKLKINGVEWIGNVEIHVKASDWFRHGHSEDPAYDNVILHVVAVSDKRISRPDGSLIPQIELTFPEKFFHTYSFLAEEMGSVKCGSMLRNLPQINKTDWLESLAVERMQQKAGKVNEILAATGGDWEQTCFIMLARGFGFGLNGDPFELLAKSIPLKILHHHSDNLFQLEALLFGQAGMLDSSLHIFDDYYQGLCREYYFLARKYGLKPMNAGLWKYSRTRPQNFPHRRIALLSSSAYGGFALFTRLLEAGNKVENLLESFDMKAAGYWQSHFAFDTEVSDVPTQLSKSSRLLLIINVAVPLLYSYAASVGELDLAESTLGLMQQLPAESNVIIKQWASLGLEAKDASRSQALIHLKKEYCDKNKCIYCRFGHHYLRKSAQRED